MTTKSRIAGGGAYLITAAGSYVVAEDTAPSQPLITPNADSLTPKARHIEMRAGSTSVTRSTGKDIYTRGGTQPLVTPGNPFIVG